MSLLQLQMIIALVVALGVVIATKGKLGFSDKNGMGSDLLNSPG